VGVKIRSIAWVSLAAGILLYAVPARSTTPPPVGVSLTVEDTLHRISCWLTIPAGSNGLALLKEARRIGCISSYTTYFADYPPSKSYLSCVGWDRHNQHSWDPRRQHISDCEGGGIGIVKQWSVEENGSQSNVYWNGGLEALHNDAGDHYLFDLHLVCCYG